MANNYYDMTGVLVLDKVTDVIKALFGTFELDENYPGNGQAYIACISESSNCSWDSVLENLQKLVKRLGLTRDEDEGAQGETVGEVLQVLSRHFNATQHEGLKNLIQSSNFDDDADLDSLFLIAGAFDDGHGLKAYKTETAWHCSKPRLFEFGGSGWFTGSHVAVGGSSNQIVGLGENLESALATGNTGAAAEVIQAEIGSLLAGIYDDGTRDDVRGKLIQLLSA